MMIAAWYFVFTVVGQVGEVTGPWESKVKCDAMRELWTETSPAHYQVKAEECWNGRIPPEVDVIWIERRPTPPWQP